MDSYRFWNNKCFTNKFTNMNNTVLIPTEYKVNGLEVKTSVEDSSDSKNLYGRFYPSSCEVKLYKICNGVKVCSTQMKNTAYHEMVHAVLESMAEFELSDNEKFVSNMANAICQIVDSVKMKPYDELIGEIDKVVMPVK